MVPVQVLSRVLEFAIYSLVRLLQNLRPRSFRSPKMRFHIVDKHRQALRSVPELCGTRAIFFRLMDHDPRLAEMDLRPAQWLAIPVVLSETECLTQPLNRFGKALILDVRQQGVSGQRAILDHCVSSRCRVPVIPGTAPPPHECQW